MRRSDPLILGGGPAGSAVALALAQGGSRSLILERQRIMGDTLCGGFLSWHTLRQLDRLGIARDELRGHPIDHVQVFSGKRNVSAALPAGAIGLSRQRLDSVLLAKAVASGAAIETVNVRGIEGDTVSTDTGTVTAGSIFLATGKYDLRGAARPRQDADNPTLGLRIHIGPHPALTALIGSSIELHLFDRGYAGLLLQEDGRANLCMAARKSRLTEAGGKPEALLAALALECPQLAERLAWLDAAPQPDAIAAVPYGWRAIDTRRGLFRLGDQAAVIPSLAGEGIGIAIASGVAAAESWLRGGAAAAPVYQRAFAARARRPVAAAQFLWERGETPWSATLAVRMLALAPWLAGLVAKATRIGD